MTRATVIARRELSSYFYSPIAYVLMVILLLCAILFWNDFKPGEPAAMRTLFDQMINVLVFIVPVLCMGLLAQEWATGTIETMMTAPVSETDVVLGKFFGSLGFLIILLAPTLLYVVLLRIYGHPDFGPILSGYIGLILVGSAFIAVALLCSASTKSQIVAAVAAAAVLSLVTILPWIAGGFAEMPTFWCHVIDQAVARRYSDFSRGVLDTGNVVFFVVSTAVFLFITIKVLESEAVEMSNQPNKSEANFQPESQADRWIKYGSNVLLSVILVIALGVGLIWFAEHTNARKDMTLNGSLSLKPQTVAVVKDLKQHITLVSLYVRPSDKPDDVAEAQRVSDLLDEYKDKSSNIDVKIIDPAKEKDKLEDLHQEFINRYGKSIKGYKDYLESWQKTYSQVKKLTDAEASGVAPFNTPGLGQQDEVMQEIVSTLSDEAPQGLEDAHKAVDHELRQKHPDYKGAAATAKGVMEKLSQLAGQLAELAPKAQGTPRLPPEFKKYMLQSMPHFQEIKKITDASVAAGGKLGELKVDQLEQALTVDNPILVLGDNDWRILQQDQVWQPDTDVHAATASGKNKPRFAGEQQVTTAIFGLENPIKKKVCFVRSGGEAVTQHGFMGIMPNGAMSVIADRLREYNFDVTEKDFSGMSAMQAQMQGTPAPPEPTDEQIKDAIWVVLDVPQRQQQQQQMPLPPLGPKVKQHLEEGGSALILPDIGGDKLTDALKDWGVELHPEAIGVHEKINVDGSSSTDPVQRAMAQSLWWDIRDYGEHPLAAPIKNLDGLFFAPTVVRATSAKGCTITPLLPLTMKGAKVWGETDFESVNKQAIEYNADKDLAAPIFAGAVVEKQGAGRLVVIGSMQSMTDFFMHVWDPTLLNRDPRVYVNRSPGNGELFANSMFWLAHLEPMIAISPSAMDVPRIDDMSDRTLHVWKIGVLMILLPGIVLAAGAFVYVSRRD